MLVMRFRIGRSLLDESLEDLPLFDDPQIFRIPCLVVRVDELVEGIDQRLYFIFAVLAYSLPIHYQ